MRPAALVSASLVFLSNRFPLKLANTANEMYGKNTKHPVSLKTHYECTLKSIINWIFHD